MTRNNNITPQLGPLEQKIVQIFWENPCSEVRFVHQELEKNGEKLAYTTVMTIMKRLVDKKILSRKLKGKQYYYTIKDSKQGFVQKLIKKTLHNFINRFGEEAVVAFLSEAEKLSAVEKTRLIKKIKK